MAQRTIEMTLSARLASAPQVVQRIVECPLGPAWTALAGHARKFVVACSKIAHRRTNSLTETHSPGAW